MDYFLKNWNEIHTGGEALINLSSAIDAFENLPNCYLANHMFFESFCSAEIIKQAVHFLKHKDKCISYTAVKLMSMIFKRQLEIILSVNINFDELQNVDLCINILSVIYKEFSKCSMMDTVEFFQLFHRYNKYINKVIHLCISLLRLKETIGVHNLLSVLQCCKVVFKIYHKVKLNLVNTENSELFIGQVFDTLSELVYWLVIPSGVTIGCNNVTLIFQESQHLVWRYVVKLIFKVAIAIPDLSNFLYDPVLKSFCLNVSCYLRLNFIDNIKVVKSNFTTTLIEKNFTCIDESTARKLILFGIKTMLLEFPQDENNLEVTDQVLKRFLNLLSKFDGFKSETLISSLISIFTEQDDEQVLILKLLLSLFIKSRKLTKFQKNFEYINPHLLFSTLLNVLFYDELVLLDWLVSVEVDFLDYFKLYLAFIIESFEFFVSSLDTDFDDNRSRAKSSLSSSLVENRNSAMPLVNYSSSDEELDDSDNKKISIQLDKIMSCFIRLRLMLERMNNQNLLSNEVALIIPLLENVEDFYDKYL